MNMKQDSKKGPVTVLQVSGTPPLASPAEKDSVKTEPARTQTADTSRRGPGRPPNPKPAEPVPVASPQLPVIVLGPDFADTSLKFLGGAMALIAHATTKVPFDDCERVLGFSASQRTMITPALAPVLDKYVGEWIRTHQSEMALIMLATPILTANVMTFAALAKEHKKKLHDEKNRAPRPVSAAAVMPAPSPSSPAAPSPSTEQVM